MNSNREIWVAGYPSFYGGADTELDHNIDLWRMHGVDVNLVPMFGTDPQMEKLCTQRGCKTLRYRPGIFKDKIVTSFCNGEFLAHLPKIEVEGKPRAVVWFNCMTYTFDNEVSAHRNGLIDYHGFVSKYQKTHLEPVLSQIRPVNEFEGYKPFFNVNSPTTKPEFKYRTEFLDKWFSVGRISRDDYSKFTDDMWNIFYKVCTPNKKKVFILGYGPNARQRTGDPPDGMDWQTWSPHGTPVGNVYKLLNCIIHKTGGSRESYCRIVPEAYAYGVPLIVERDYAFPDLIVDGVTGYMCKSSDEMSFRASELAFDEEKRKKMIFAAHDHLINEIASQEKCWSPWDRLFKELS
jgi:glycosyltransferase involved in cell wall biosynthesis